MSVRGIPNGDPRRWSSGQVILIAALAAIPLIAVTGLAVDYARIHQFQTSLQNVADSAALAGASELTSSTSLASSMATKYVNAGIPRLPANKGVTSTVSVPNANTVTVTATGKVSTSFMAIFNPLVTVTVSATAGYPQGIVTVTMAAINFKADAADSNTIYWYIVPSDNSVPLDTMLTPLFSNDPKEPLSTPKPFPVRSGDKIGFALKNITGGLSGYGSNQYGGAAGSIHMFYSHLNPPSQIAYPGNGENNLKINGTPTNNYGANTLGAQSCAQTGTSTVNHAWNDMGGKVDDFDYNDATYSYSCSGSGGGGGGGPASGVVLIK